MIISVVSMVRNEADVIESFVRHNLCWADRIYVAVHESTDETLRILQSLQKDGLPIFLSEVSGAAQVQSEVVTALVRQAVEEGADFVLPLDADEFLLPDGNSPQGKSMKDRCRGAFSLLEETKVYAIPWVRYVPGGGQGFLLSRKAYREKWPEKISKALLGAKAVQEAGLSVSQGSHLALLPKKDGERQAIVPETVTGLHIAHFPWRSEGQAAKKAAVGWLGNVAKYTRYTRTAHQWREGYRKLMMGHGLQAEPLRNPVKAPRLPGSELVRLCYTPPEEESTLMSLLMEAAEQLAEECAEREARLRAVPISIVMLYRGNLELFARTVSSAVAADYPVKEYIVLAPDLDETGEGDMMGLLEQQPVESICLLIGLKAWDDLREGLKGDYIQWLPEGSELMPDRLIKMAAALSSQDELGVMLSSVEPGAYLSARLAEGTVFELDTGREVFMPGDGSQAAQSMWDSGQNFPGGLAAALFSRRHLEVQGWPLPKDWLEHEGRELLASLLMGRAYGYIAEPLLRIEQ